MTKRHGWARLFNRISLDIVDTYPSQRLKKRPVLYSLLRRRVITFVNFESSKFLHSSSRQISEQIRDWL